jgi:hypothetical protein
MQHDFNRWENHKKWKVWRGQPDNKHTRAFCYWCRRSGTVDRIVAQYNTEGKLDIAIKEAKHAYPWRDYSSW